MNKTAFIEWIKIAYHDYKSAQILYDANHYTDSIGNDLQQAIEKILKSTFAFHNKKIPKTHDLFELYDLIDEIALEEQEIDFLDIATEYFKEDRYPNPHYSLPEREEIKTILDFTYSLLEKVCKLFNISLNEIK
ncbi:MAG: HEPN domain-containing protein [Sulfurimonas sp.]|nr:HEPN domain-containing protein [Sulfurimonas sp.]